MTIQKSKLTYVYILITTMVSGLFLLILAHKDNPSTSFQQVKGVKIVEIETLSEQERNAIGHPLKAASTPKMIYGLGDKETGEAVITVKPKLSVVGEYQNAKLKLGFQKSGMLARAFDERGITQSQKSEIRNQNEKVKFKNFLNLEKVNAQVDPQPQLATVIEVEQPKEDELIFKLAEGLKIKQQVTPLMYRNEIVIEKPELINQNEPLKFKLVYEGLVPILDDKTGDIVFVKKEDQDKRTANGYIPSWAFRITNDSFAFDANKKKWPMDTKINANTLELSFQDINWDAVEFPLTIDPHVTSSGNTRTFDGGAVCSGTETWNTAGNWSTDTLPTTGDAVVFDGTCNTAVTGDTVANNILSLSLNTGYSSTLTLNVNAVSSGMSWHMNTMTVNTGTLALNGDTATDSIPGGVNDGTGWTITAQDLTVASGASINANGKGFAGGTGGGSGSGPGGGIGGSPGGGGGGYGGTGGSTNGGAPYGSVTSPLSLGSGGGSWNGTGGTGGGAIILSVTGTLTVSGTLSANGGNGQGPSGNFDGGGSGGTVNITTGILTGSGSITANGGNAFGSGAGGGGGRIKIIINGPSGGSIPSRTVNAGTGGTGAAAGTNLIDYREVVLRGGATLRGGVIFR